MHCSLLCKLVSLVCLSATTHEVASYQIQVLQYQSDFSHADWSRAVLDETRK